MRADLRLASLLVAAALGLSTPSSAAGPGGDRPPDPAADRLGEGYPDEPPPPPPPPQESPQRATPTAAAAPKSADPCDDVPQCRLDRFRRRLAARRRKLYLEELDDAAAALDERLTRKQPFRKRYPIEIDALITTNLAMPGLVIAYTPTWWFKPEIWVGRYSQSQSTYDPLTFNDSYDTFEATSGGLQARFLPVNFALSPYLAAGWGMMSGKVNHTDYNGFNGQNGTGSSHFFTLGLGLELTVPYFHVAIGYQWLSSYYEQGAVESMNDETLRKAVMQVVNGHVHGAAIEVGCAF